MRFYSKSGIAATQVSRDTFVVFCEAGAAGKRELNHRRTDTHIRTRLP